MITTRRVVLDIDGTLLDSIPAHERAFNAALASCGLPTVMDWAGEIIEYTDGWVLDAVYSTVHGCTPSRDFVAAFEATFHRALLADLDTNPLCAISGAQAFLSALAERPNTAVAFATGSFGAAARIKLAVLGEAVVPDWPLASSTGLVRRSAIVDTAINSLPAGGPIIVVGDGEWDRREARTRQAAFLGINYRGLRLATPATGECYLDDFSDLPAVLAALDRLCETQ